MTGYKAQFKGKKITVMGLGLLGRGLGYTKFLAECGAILTVTDLKTKAQLASSVKALSSPKQGFGLIKFVLGKHRLEDFRNADMIIKSAGVPLDSIYIKEAQKNNIPIEMDASLFAQMAPEVIVIGVTGTRGKSMTTMLIYEILKANEKFLKRNVHLGGNIRGVATLPLLKKVKDGDIVVMELDSWQLQGFGEANISPDISVFTSFMPDHMNYYKDDLKKYFADKANIFKYQQKGDVLVIRPNMKKLIPKNIVADLIVADKKDVIDWKFIVPGSHQLENLSCAVEVAKQFDIPISNIKKAVADFKGMEGRLQFVTEIKGVKIYNDNNATTPEATMAGLDALGKEKNIILICGGNDKNLDLKEFVKAMSKYCKSVILLEGTGTKKLITNYQLRITNEKAKNLKDAVKLALGLASRGDIILFSPAFSSFSQWNNEYERNDEFMKIVKGLK
ncbi:UDP-N-acetylmuramoyl-L-alanine--D-glutamate ligase [Candidatus Nomurabacteria bacterium]|nr:UDP-N-acetylmuramoyl-L-alanine--D-glutamate ligase [Candidatus Nomurabacteria bacterium]